jgi:hypothetical protein
VETKSGSLEDGLRFEKRLDPIDAKFATHAGVFEPTERRLLIVKQAVDRNAAGEDPRGYAPRALNVRAAHVSVEAVLRIVGDSDRILLVRQVI